MKESEPTEQESNDPLTEDIPKILYLSPGVRLGVCVGCGTSFFDGETVLGYTVQSAADPVPELAHATCEACGPIPHRRFTLGVRELIVRGHAGTVANTRTQSTRQILLESELDLVSPAHTHKAYPPEPSLWPSGSLADRLAEDGDAASQQTPLQRDRGQGDSTRGDGGNPQNGNERGETPEISDDHLSGDYAFEGALDGSALPDLYVSLVVEPAAEHLFIEQPPDPRRLPDTEWEPRTVNEWLRFGIAKQLRREGVDVCHPWQEHASHADEIDWRILSEGYHKPGTCVAEGERCFLHELWGSPGHPGQLKRHPVTFTTPSPANHSEDAVALEGIWRLTLDTIRPEYVGLITSAISALAATQDSFILDVGGTHSLPVEVRDASVLNPLYSPAETLTALTTTSISGSMSAKRVMWIDEVRDGFTEALSDRIEIDASTSSVEANDA